MVRKKTRAYKVKWMNHFIEEAEKELALYNKTKKEIYFRQAGNKLYNAHIYFLEAHYNVEIRSHPQLRKYSLMMIQEDPEFNDLKANVNSLHGWFYEGVDDDLGINISANKAVSLLKKFKSKYLYNIR